MVSGVLWGLKPRPGPGGTRLAFGLLVLRLTVVGTTVTPGQPGRPVPFSVEPMNADASLLTGLSLPSLGSIRGRR